MKKFIVITLLFSLFLANVSAQLKVNSLGDTYASKNIYLGNSSNFLGTTASNIPVTFKVNNTIVGYTGHSGSTNVFFGYMSGNGGMANTVIGYHALYYSTGHANTANGYGSLYNNTSGCGNTAIGQYALRSNTYGNNNTAIGNNADVNANNLNNATAIGNGAIVKTDNTIVLGNSIVSSILLHTNPILTSDGRTKKNIRAEVPGLTFINRLQPVMYNFDLDALDELEKSDDPKINAFRDSIRNARSPEEKEIIAKARADKEAIVYSGFIAQDVEKTALSVGYDFSGVDAPENGKGTYGLRYAEFVVPLVKAVQELSEQNNAKDAAIASLQEQNNRLQEQVNELYKLIGKENAPEKVISGLPEAATGGTSLEQNIPNPFSQNTQIKFYIPETVKVAQLCIYNLQGAQLKQIPLTQRGAGSEIISGSQFAAGIYLYALIVDGKEVDVKRMILTE